MGKHRHINPIWSENFHTSVTRKDLAQRLLITERFKLEYQTSSFFNLIDEFFDYVNFRKKEGEILIQQTEE